MPLIHAGFFSAPPAVPVTLFQATVGADTTFDPAISNFGATDVNWDFGGGATNVNGGSGSQSVAITGAPVNVEASTTATIPVFSIDSRSDELTQILAVHTQCNGVDFRNNANLGDTSDAALTNLPLLRTLDIRNCSFTTKSLTGLPDLRNVFIQGNNFAAIPDFTGLTQIRDFACGFNNLAGVIDLASLSAAASFFEFNCNNNAITQLNNIPTATRNLIVTSNNITDLDVSTLTNLVQLECLQNDLSIASIDQMLIDLDSFGAAFAAGLTLDYSSQNIAGTHLDVNRSGAAAAAKTNLLANGLTLNGTY